MEALSLDIFIVPTIALTVVVLLYLYFAKQVRDKKIITTISSVSVQPLPSVAVTVYVVVLV